MSNPRFTMKLIQYYAAKKKDSVIPFPSFLAFVKQYADMYRKKQPDLELYITNTQAVLNADLEELASVGKISLEYEDVDIVIIHYPLYYIELIEKEYRDIEESAEKPFPGSEGFAITIPDSLLTRINVKADFVDWLGREDRPENSLLCLDYPEDFKHMYITSRLFYESLLKISIEKIRVYLRDQRNMKYVFNKMSGIFGKREVFLQDFLEELVRNPAKAAEVVMNPTEFSFRSWTTLANLIFQEFKPKTSKLAIEVSICQAAYIIGYYNVYYKGLARKEQEVKDALKQLDFAVRKPPHVFTLSEIYEFTDSKGVLLRKKFGREKLNEYLEKKTRTEDEDSFPEIFRIHTDDGKEYYIPREHILTTLTGRVDEVGTEFARTVIEEWMGVLKKFKKSPEMKQDDAFVSMVERRFKERDPLAVKLLSYELLYLLSREVDVNSDLRREIEGYLDTEKKAVKRAAEIMRLDRRTLLDEAKSRIPVTYTTPILRGLFRILLRLAGGRKKKSLPEAKNTKGGSSVKVMGSGTGSSRPSHKKAIASISETGKESGKTETSKSNLTAFRKQVKQLEDHFLGDAASVDRSLESLIDNWNHLIDERARRHLVEDVNSAINDYLRRFKGQLIANPPGVDDVQKMAIHLSQQPIFRDISRKDPFWRYIELYIVQTLLKT